MTTPQRYSPYLKLGVELEVEVKNDPSPATTHESSYVIYGSYPKHNNLGHIHKKHGHLISLSDKATNKVETHLDNTINDGWEWIGNPMTLNENKTEWAKLLDHEGLKPYIHGEDVEVTNGNGFGIHDVGMHVHVSGDPITKEVMGRLLVFMNSNNNKEFLEVIAGRKFNKFCETQAEISLQDAELLYHSIDCRKPSKRDKKIVYRLNGTWDTNDDEGIYCCDNSKRFTSKGFKRGAIWVTPVTGSGDFEIRIFKSTVNLHRFYTNLEFVVALVEFCVDQLSLKEKLLYKDFGVWLARIENKVKYQHLFKFMRKHGYVDGIIPKKETLLEMIRKGKVSKSVFTLGKVA